MHPHDDVTALKLPQVSSPVSHVFSEDMAELIYFMTFFYETADFCIGIQSAILGFKDVGL
jgi:hypothetical protein